MLQATFSYAFSWMKNDRIFIQICSGLTVLTHWGRVTHICVGKLTITGSDNGLSPGRRQAVIWTNAEILLIKLLGTKFSEILIKIDTFSLKKMHLKVSSGKWRQFCLGLNVLNAVQVNLELADVLGPLHSGYKELTFLLPKPDTHGADDLAPWVAKLSAAMVAIVCYEEKIQLPVPTQCWDIMGNANMFSYFLT